MSETFTPRPETNCDRCGGTGWIATKGYRFYSNNGRVCTTCNRFADANDCGWYFQAEREATAKADAEALYAAQKAARAERRAARKAAEQG